MNIKDIFQSELDIKLFVDKQISKGITVHGIIFLVHDGKIKHKLVIE